ncbi:MAG: IS110 family transposase [Aestuariivirgaceae bacterium]
MLTSPIDGKCHIGIDVSKASVDIHCLETGLSRQIPNTGAAIRKTFNVANNRLCGAFVVIDMAGGHERLACEILSACGIAVHRAQPYRVKSYIRACGQLAKTDRIDARLLAQYGQERRANLPLFQQHDRQQLELKALVQRRDDLVAMQTQEKNRLSAPAMPRSVARTCKAVLATLERQIKSLANQIDKLIAQHEATRSKAAILQNMPGIGPQTTRTLIALMPELGSMTERQAASLAGLAPRANDSGTRKGHRYVRGGRPAIRRAMFIAALSAARHDQCLKAHYQSLLKRGKKPIVAITAIARKLIVIANARLKELTQMPQLS